MNYEYNDYELVYLVKESNEDALDIIIKKYDPIIKNLAFSYAKKWCFINIDVEDLIQEGRVSLYKSLDNYDESTLFYTFVILCIKRAMSNYVRNMLKKSFVLINDYVDEDMEYNIFIDDKKNPSDIVEEFYDVSRLIDFKNTLSFYEALIFELKMNGFKYIEIAQLLDINIKKVDNQMLKIRAKLKKYLLKEK